MHMTYVQHTNIGGGKTTYNSEGGVTELLCFTLQLEPAKVTWETWTLCERTHNSSTQQSGKKKLSCPGDHMTHLLCCTVECYK